MRHLINLAEAYAYGFKTFRGAQCDVFKNPSRKEWQEAAADNGDVRALLVGDDILVWNTFAAVHQMVRDEMRIPADAIPLVIYGSIGQEALALVTDNSRGSIWWHNCEVVTAILSHPFMKRNFVEIEVDFYDADVVGDWCADDFDV